MECIFKVSEDTLDLAQKLAAQDDTSQVNLRAAVGRAYYSAYYFSRILAAKCPIPANLKGGSHEQVVRCLEEIPLTSLGNRKHAQTVRKIGKWLRSARTLRVQADYHLTEELTADDFRTVENLARKIARDARSLLDELHAA